MKKKSSRSTITIRKSRVYRIKAFYHGGTIAMEKNKLGEFAPPKDDSGFRLAISQVVSYWKKERASNFTVDYSFVTAEDSIHITDAYWTALIFKIKEAQDEGYDGILIAHGTDTMTYTVGATALGLLGGSNGLRIPVVFTGSQKPLGIFGGDADMNLQHSLMVLQEAIQRSRPIADVMLVFGTNVMLGCRSMKTSESKFDAFHSPSEAGKVGYIDASGAYLDESRLRLKEKATGRLIVSPHFYSGVHVQVLSANTSPAPLKKLVELGMIKALVLLSPGSGNAPIEGLNNFIPLIEFATQEAHVPVIICSQYVGGTVGHGVYPTGNRILEAGASASFDTTQVLTEVKASWALARGITSPDGVRNIMAQSVAGEVSRPAMKLHTQQLRLPKPVKEAGAVSRRASMKLRK